MRVVYAFWLGTFVAISLRLFINKFAYWDLAYAGFVSLVSLLVFLLDHYILPNSEGENE